jgi:hypothetical protein
MRWRVVKIPAFHVNIVESLSWNKYGGGKGERGEYRK